MKYCARCGCQLPYEASFCNCCGAPCIKRCAGCGAELPEEASFCNHCGMRQDDSGEEERFGFDAYQNGKASSAPADTDVNPNSGNSLEGGMYTQSGAAAATFADVKNSLADTAKTVQGFVAGKMAQKQLTGSSIICIVLRVLTAIAGFVSAGLAIGYAVYGFIQGGLYGHSDILMAAAGGVQLIWSFVCVLHKRASVAIRVLYFIITLAIIAAGIVIFLYS